MNSAPPETPEPWAPVQAAAAPGVEWRISPGLTDYAAALAGMEARALAIAERTACERLWLLEHPPVYTAGTSAKAADLLDPGAIPVHVAGRGGQYTYHGPGQRIVYIQLDVGRRGRDVRGFVTAIEQWIIAALAEFGVAGVTRCDRVGVWVVQPDGREDKIAAIGIRLRRWVSLHGLSINVAPDLTAFDGIVPCGIRSHGVTSLRALGHATTLADLDAALWRTRDRLLGPPSS